MFTYYICNNPAASQPHQYIICRWWIQIYVEDGDLPISEYWQKIYRSIEQQFRFFDVKSLKILWK